MNNQTDGNLGALAFAALTTDCPHPPPIDDNPPLHVFMLSLGFMLGMSTAKHKLQPRVAGDALSWLSSKKTPQEVIELIWGKTIDKKPPL